MKSTFQVWINNIQTLLSLVNDAWVIYWLLKLMRLDFIGVLLKNEVIKPCSNRKCWWSNMIENCLVTKHFLVWTLFDCVWSPNISSVDRALQHLSFTTFCGGFMASCEVGVEMPAGAASDSLQVPFTIGTGELALSTVGGCSLQLQWKKKEDWVKILHSVGDKLPKKYDKKFGSS